MELFLGLSVFYGIPLLAGYFIGSVPFGLILTRLAGLGDVRTIGSGNIGATNVLRTGNKKLAALTLLLDMGKGVAAVSLYQHICTTSTACIEFTMPDSAALGVLLGHMFPVWLKFKGGKGVATYLGVLLALYWPAAALFAGVWFSTWLLFRISSIAGMLATLSPLLYLFPKFSWPLSHHSYYETGHLFYFMLVSAFLILYRHKDNIRRLLKGEEKRLTL